MTDTQVLLRMLNATSMVKRRYEIVRVVGKTKVSGISIDRSTRKNRRCLGNGCGRVFSSEGPWHRFCGGCDDKQLKYGALAEVQHMCVRA